MTKLRRCMFKVRIGKEFRKIGKSPRTDYGDIPPHLMNKYFLAYMPDFMNTHFYDTILVIVDPKVNLLRIWKVNSLDIDHINLMTKKEVKEYLTGRKR